MSTCSHPSKYAPTYPCGNPLPCVNPDHSEVAPVSTDVQRKAIDALRFYADERNWLNGCEMRGFPGFHGRQIAANALAAVDAQPAAESEAMQ